MTAMMTDRPNGLQIKPGDGCKHVESGLGFKPPRLEGERIVQSAAKAVGSDADADRRPTGNADITAGQRARAKARCCRQHNPAQRHIIGKTDLRSEAADSAT